MVYGIKVTVNLKACGLSFLFKKPMIYPFNLWIKLISLMIRNFCLLVCIYVDCWSEKDIWLNTYIYDGTYRTHGFFPKIPDNNLNIFLCAWDNICRLHDILWHITCISCILKEIGPIKVPLYEKIGNEELIFLHQYKRT